MAMHNPPYPGEFIRATYIESFDISIRSLAKSLGVSPSTLTRLISRQSGISPEMALRLSKAVGRSPESWLAMQHNYDSWQTKKRPICQVSKKWSLKRRNNAPQAGCWERPHSSPWREREQVRGILYSLSSLASSGTCSVSYCSIKTPMTSINEASGCVSSSPTVSTRLSSKATRRPYSASVCGTNRQSAMSGQCDMAVEISGFVILMA